MDINKLPVGPKDKPFLILNPKQKNVIEYDFTDRNGDLYMLDHDFEGSISIPFSKPVYAKTGKVILDGKNISYVVKNVKIIQNIDVTMLGIKLRGRMAEYNQVAHLEISGFTDYNGNTMPPVSLEIKTLEKMKPLKKYCEHENVALHAAEDGMVLLENKENLLPFRHKSYLNVFGSGLYDFQVCAVGAGKINPRYIVDFREAVNESEYFELNQELEDFYRCDRNAIPSEELLKRARMKSEIGVFIITRANGENMDNNTDLGEFYLSEDEESLLQKICEIFPKRIVILNVGYPISMSFVKKYHIQSVLYCGFGGMLAGKAIVNVLSGMINPSGKLPDTWVYEYLDLPSANDFYNCNNGKERYNADANVSIDTVYHEDVFVGYRYFETYHKRAAYPFGYGLSYTNFNKKVISIEYESHAGLSAEIEITNIGQQSGREVVMLYLKKPDTHIKQPDRELIAYAKTRLLKANEKQTIQLYVEEKYLALYDEKQSAYLISSGQYEVYLGGDVAHASQIYLFNISENRTVKKVKHLMVPLKPISESVSCVRNDALLKEKRLAHKYPYNHIFSKENKDQHITFKDVMKDESLLDHYVLSLSPQQLARLVICSGDGWGMEGTGEAGRLAQIDGDELPKMVVADGNSGVNMRKKNIGMPSGVTICASFDKELAKNIGRVIGEEARELGIDLILAPSFNIHRNPLCGRQAEYFSEDPYLAGTMAASYCAGLEQTGVGGCYKHLMANNAEASRKHNQSIVSERALREIYAKAFAIALDQYEPVSVMTSYNAINGEFTSCDADLLQGLLRDEWHFKGFIMTDWGSYDSADIIEMINAGNDWITPGSSDDTYTSIICKAIKNRRLDIKRLRENVWYLLKALLKLTKMEEKE